MRTKVDKYGRLVIPKYMRESLGLSADTPVEVEQEGGEIVIRPVNNGELVEKDGLLVYTGSVSDPNPKESRRRARSGGDERLREIFEEDGGD